jgi:DNA-binding NtrC family response regulator
MGESIRLLLVDDEQAFINVLGKRLARRGVEATLAASGAEAIQRLRSNDFDVAVVDLKMEGMDGIELLGVFKKMLPQMPVIILTGHGSERAAREGVRQGAFDYLLKPCELDRLLEKIDQAVRGR